MIKRIKIWIFNKQFNRYYEALLLGELYGIKIKLLLKLKKDKNEYLNNYLYNGISFYKQMLNEVESL